MPRGQEVKVMNLSYLSDSNKEKDDDNRQQHQVTAAAGTPVR